MPTHRIAIDPRGFYHIYNRGINSCPLFVEHDNYTHFLRLYDRYVSPIANTFAWALMGNHFHLLVQILPVERWGLLNPEGFGNFQGLGADKRISQQFSNLFNAYTKAFNKRYGRTGSLMEHTFRRKPVTGCTYLKQLMYYIHYNPVRHGMCKHPVEYAWSSYQTCIAAKPTKLQRDMVIGWFGDGASFRRFHDGNTDLAHIDE
ncbi:MAG: hypothetical protein QM786_16720 [Breznakibacter sp.]